MRPTWAEISLTALRHNFRTVLDYVAPNATVCAVVKADAYGHGAAECAKALEAEGATWFGVTGPDEGIRLRQAGITSRILLLSGFWRGEEEAVVEHDLTPAVWDLKTQPPRSSPAALSRSIFTWRTAPPSPRVRTHGRTWCVLGSRSTATTF